MRKRIKTAVARLLQQPFLSRQERLRQTRSANGPVDFAEVFPNATAIAAEVWARLRSVAVVDEFPVHPDDDLTFVYGLADDDLDSLCLDLLRRCGCRIPDPKETAKLSPVRTAADLVKFLAAMQAEIGDESG